jgi:hypothetical protein
MSQLQKTLVFVGVATASVAIAYATRPGPAGVAAPESLNDPLFAEFTDPLKAKSLRIVRFDEGLSKLRELEVRENAGIWTLPSHENYPADAKDRIKDATTQFVGLKPISIVGDNQGDHDLYGVLEPGGDKSTVGEQGVGTLVNVQGDGGSNLVNLIIGKEVKGSPDQRYVRRSGQALVYTAKVNPTNLPVKFDDWIEKDLLKLDGWNLSQMTLKDYTFQVAATLSGAVTDFDQRLEVTVSDDNGKWKLDKMLVARDEELQPAQLTAGEELNQEKLNGLKTALDQLEIVDVERKPTTLGEDLRAGAGFFNDQSGVDSLLQRGFYPVRVGNGADDIELLSSDGEVLARTKEGVEYVLRFGRVKEVDTESSEGKLNRYLLVAARVNTAQFPQPELLPLPETVEDLQKKPADAAATPEKPSTESTDDAAKPVDDANESPPESSPESSVEPPADATSQSPDDATRTLPVAGQPESTGDQPAEDVSAPAQPATTPAPESSSAEVPAAEAPATPATAPPNAAPPASGATTPPAPDTADPARKLQEERERITKENQRKIDERKDKLTAAQKKVNELNFRFADWYYVISEDVYKKIHLSQSDLIKVGEKAKEEGFGPDALRNLQDQGLPAPPN